MVLTSDIPDIGSANTKGGLRFSTPVAEDSTLTLNMEKVPPEELGYSPDQINNGVVPHLLGTGHWDAVKIVSVEDSPDTLTEDGLGSNLEYVYHEKLVNGRLQIHVSLSTEGNGVGASEIVEKFNEFKLNLGITEREIDILVEGPSAVRKIKEIREDLAEGFGVYPEEIHLEEHDCSDGCSGCGNRSVCRDSTTHGGSENRNDNEEVSSSLLPTIGSQENEETSFPTLENQETSFFYIDGSEDQGFYNNRGHFVLYPSEESKYARHKEFSSGIDIDFSGRSDDLNVNLI